MQKTKNIGGECGERVGWRKWRIAEKGAESGGKCGLGGMRKRLC